MENDSGCFFSRSQVDGYAILASDITGASYDLPVRLELAGETNIGEKAVNFPGPGIIFHGVRVKPGKPVIFAMSGEKSVFGLPGFPVSYSPGDTDL